MTVVVNPAQVEVADLPGGNARTLLEVKWLCELGAFTILAG